MRTHERPHHFGTHGRTRHPLLAPALALAALSFCAWSPLAMGQAKSDAGPSDAPAASTSSVALTSPAAVAAKVQKVYDLVTSFEADFDQQYTMKAFGKEKTSKGHVVFVKPGKMRWDYTQPKDNLVVSDAVTLWSYVAADKQARKMLVKDSQMPTALAFLTGKGDLAKDFDLKLVAIKDWTGYVLDATPKVATNLYTHVFFYVDRDTFHVRRVLIVDAQDNRNRFDFAKPKVNEKVTASFTWTAPAGVAVVTN